MSRLVVVSNRIAVPDGSGASAGGLAVGILDALKTTGDSGSAGMATSAPLVKKIMKTSISLSMKASLTRLSR